LVIEQHLPTRTLWSVSSKFISHHYWFYSADT